MGAPKRTRGRLPVDRTIDPVHPNSQDARGRGRRVTAATLLSDLCGARAVHTRLPLGRVEPERPSQVAPAPHPTPVEGVGRAGDKAFNKLQCNLVAGSAPVNEPSGATSPSWVGCLATGTPRPAEVFIGPPRANLHSAHHLLLCFPTPLPDLCARERTGK